MKSTARIVEKLRLELARDKSSAPGVDPTIRAAQAVADQIPWRELIGIAREYIESVALEIQPIVTVFGTREIRQIKETRKSVYKNLPKEKGHEPEEADWGEGQGQG